MNLAVNARDAMNGVSRLFVDVEPAGSAGEAMPHIFDPFFSTRTHGTALGLATVDDIVAGCGGRGAIERVPGCGARFRVRLPAAPLVSELPDVRVDALSRGGTRR